MCDLIECGLHVCILPGKVIRCIWFVLNGDAGWYPLRALNDMFCWSSSQLRGLCINEPTSPATHNRPLPQGSIFLHNGDNNSESSVYHNYLQLPIILTQSQIWLNKQQSWNTTTNSSQILVFVGPWVAFVPKIPRKDGLQARGMIQMPGFPVMWAKNSSTWASSVSHKYTDNMTVWAFIFTCI